MGIPDSFDPLMMLNTAKTMGQPTAANATPGDTDRHPAGMDRFDGTANTGTVYGEPMPLQTYSTPGETGLRLPEGVDNFDPLNLPAPPRVRQTFPHHSTGGQP